MLGKGKGQEMRKIMLLLTMAMVLLLTNGMCEAADKRIPVISTEEVSIGGITVGTSEEEVKEIYGEPSAEEDMPGPSAWGGPTRKSLYGDSFEITYAMSIGKAVVIKSTANNGLTSGGGFSVGDKIHSVLAKYGNGWHGGFKDKQGRPLKMMMYRSSRNVIIRFSYDDNMTITEISCFS